MHERLNRNRDARNTLDAGRHTHGDASEGASRGYHPRRGGRYDSGEDRSPSPDLLGPQAFGRHILNAIFPPWYRPPTNILKYSGETNPGLWLEDYWLACQAGGADRRFPYPQPSIVPGRFGTNVVGTPSSQLNPKLGGPKRDLLGKLLGHIRVSWEPLGSQKLLTEV